MSTAQQSGAQDAPDPENLQKSVAAAKRVVQAQTAAESLKERAAKAVNPKERMKLLEEAYNKEVEAFGQSKYAKRLQSGTWQGAAAGGGIGGGVAMGLGTVVGTLVGGVASVPTVLVGGLVGAGAGAIHGPFIKFGGGGKDKKAMTQEEIHAQAVQEAEKLDQAVETGASAVPQPPSGIESTDSASVDVAAAPTKRKPKKLEVRSVKEMPVAEKRRPRKLETRSSSRTASTT